MKKTSFLVGFAAGYTLGAKAGRERYDQIVDKANEVMGNPRVQAATQQVTDTVREKAPAMANAVTEKVSGGGSKDDTDNTGSTYSTGTAPAAATFVATTTTSAPVAGDEIPTPVDVAAIVEMQEGTDEPRGI